MKLKNISILIVGLLSALSLFVLVLFFAVQLTVFDVNFYMNEYKKYDVTKDLPMEYSEIEKVTSHMIDYLRNTNDSLNIEAKVGDETRLFFNEKELSHMVDVKLLFVGGFKIRNVVAIVFFVCAVSLFILGAKRAAILKSYKIAYASIAVIVAIVGGIILSDFSNYFVVFHEVFFDNDLWLLDPSTDLLINLLPEGFFMDCVIRVCVIFFGSFLFLLALFYGGTYIVRKRLAISSKL